jgi:hypothetical protein
MIWDQMGSRNNVEMRHKINNVEAYGKKQKITDFTNGHEIK